MIPFKNQQTSNILAISMEKEMSNTTEKSKQILSGINKLISAASMFEDLGLVKSAERITQLIEKVSK